MTPPFDPETQPLPADLRLLRRLVTTLTVVMICGLILITGVIVIRLSPKGAVLPDALVLPEDAGKAMAFTRGPGWYAIVTQSGEIIVFDAQTGALRERLDIGTAE